MKTSFTLILLSLLLSACASNPAEDPVQIKLNDLDTRLGGVERVVSNQSLVELSRRLDTLEAQLREQRGDVEVLQNGSESARKQQRDLYADLDKRIAALEGRPNVAAAAGTDTSAAGPPAAGVPAGVPAGAGKSGDEQAAYDRAFATPQGGNYGEAVEAFQSFISPLPATAPL